MDEKYEKNSLARKEESLRKLIELYVRNPDKYRAFEKIVLTTTRKELNLIESTQFQRLDDVAEQLCMDVLIDAVAEVNQNHEKVKYFVDIKEEFYLKENENKFKWPSCIEFDMHTFRSQINDYISNWNLSRGIKYCIQYQSSSSSEISDIHDFLVIFSIPTKACPNPQAVAYAYFKAECSKCLPETEPIFVTYKFERFFKKYVANNDFNFQDMIIKLVLISKSRFYSSIDF